MINCGKKRRLNKYRKFNTLYLNWSYPKYNRPQDIKQLKKMLQNGSRNSHKPITSWNGIEIQSNIMDNIVITPSPELTELAGKGGFIKLSED